MSGFTAPGTAFLVGIHSQTSAHSTNSQIFMVVGGGGGRGEKWGGGAPGPLCEWGNVLVLTPDNQIHMISNNIWVVACTWHLAL